jgi:predicted metal-dependent HD superfamily phosphohydrolase
MEFEKARDFILEKLNRELPPHLYYHNTDHILDVYNAVLRHVDSANIDAENSMLLQTAALFHDSGFIVRAAGHEALSCNFAKQYLPGFGYDDNQIEKICGMIMATKIPQSPHNYLEEVLADADLDYLGRDDFFTITAKLYKELSEAGTITSEEQWDKLQVYFFTNHHYFTDEAKQWRQVKKDEHLKILKSKLIDNN